MAWKTLKDTYRITHIVQVREGKIMIGSGYVPDLIRVSLDGEKVQWGNLGPCDGDLGRYFAEMTADPSKLKASILAPDTFAESFTVWTYHDGDIIEKKCEAFGWPNCTHDGALMYENNYHFDKPTVVQWAKKSALSCVEALQETVGCLEQRLADMRNRLTRAKANIAKLHADYPEEC